MMLLKTFKYITSNNQILILKFKMNKKKKALKQETITQNKNLIKWLVQLF